MSDMEKITQLADELKGGLTALQKAQEKQVKDTDGLVKAEVNRIAEDLGSKFEALQEKQAAVETALQRVGDITEAKGESKEDTLKKEAFNSFLRSGGDFSKLTPEHQRPCLQIT